eukprot:6175493-Pleurochrysis_carterae.AAC.4
MGALALHPGKALYDTWHDKPHAQGFDILPPPAIERHRMTENCSKKLFSVVVELWDIGNELLPSDEHI